MNSVVLSRKERLPNLTGRWYHGLMHPSRQDGLQRSCLVGQLFDLIRTLVLSGRYVAGEHAVERLEERDILEWQIVDGIEWGKLLAERPGELPNPSVEVQQLLADGTVVIAVWSHLVNADIAKLVTVYYLDN